VILEGKMEKLWDEIRKMVSMETADCTPEQARDVVDYICNELTIYRDAIGEQLLRPDTSVTYSP
jgi:hypothetical protein